MLDGARWVVVEVQGGCLGPGWWSTRSTRPGGVVTGYLDICDARYRELGKSKIVFNGDVIFL